MLSPMRAFPESSGTPLAELTPEQLADRIALYAFELSLMLRAAVLLGIEVHVDVLDRPDETYPGGSRPEVHVRVGETGWPPVEPRS